MAIFRGIQEYIAIDANNIALVFDSGNIISISGNIFLYPSQGHISISSHAIQSLIEWATENITFTQSITRKDCIFSRQASLARQCEALSEGEIVKTGDICDYAAILWELGRPLGYVTYALEGEIDNFWEIPSEWE